MHENMYNNMHNNMHDNMHDGIHNNMHNDMHSNMHQHTTAAPKVPSVMISIHHDIHTSDNIQSLKYAR